MTVKTAAEGGFEVKRDELDRSAMDAETHTDFEKLFDGKDSVTIDPSALERRFTIPELNRAIVRVYRQVLEKSLRRINYSGARRICGQKLQGYLDITNS
jgi:type I restriction enzyme, R subunit